MEVPFRSRAFVVDPPDAGPILAYIEALDGVTLEAVVKVSTEVLGPEHRDTVANQATLARLREAQ